MPPRRSHKKSRLGCQRCKQRKIKCDEVRPSCGGCEKHGVSCDFDESVELHASVNNIKSIADESLVKYSSSSSSASPQRSYSPASSSTTISVSPATSRFLELRLMHNYTAVTSYTLAAGDSTDSIQAWQFSIPALAMNSPCLMDAILAVSALHLRTIDRQDQSLPRASHAYMASAISEYSSTLSRGLDQSNAEAVFATSALIAFQASASRIFMEEDGHNEHEGYTLPLQWFHSFQGVKAIVMASWRWIRESSSVKPIISSQPALSLDLTTNGQKFFGPLLEGLDKILENEEEDSRADTRQAYEHSVAYLSWAHEKPERRRILGFPATVSKRFVELIEQKAPLALVIIAMFFAMTKAVEHEVWWLLGIARLEVNGIYGLLPDEYRPMIDWAMMVANAEQGIINEEIWGASWYSDDVMEEVAGNVSDHIDLLTQMDLMPS